MDLWAAWSAFDFPVTRRLSCLVLLQEGEPDFQLRFRTAVSLSDPDVNSGLQPETPDGHAATRLAGSFVEVKTPITTLTYNTFTVTWSLVRGGTDADRDGIPDQEDNSPPTAGGGTRNISLDGDPELSVPATWNPDQKDSDGDGVVTSPTLTSHVTGSHMGRCRVRPTLAIPETIPTRPNLPISPMPKLHAPRSGCQCWIRASSLKVRPIGDGTALLSGYLNQQRNTTRIIHVDLSDGRALDFRDVEKGGHGGGIAKDATGRIWVASTGKLLHWPSLGSVFTSAAPAKVTISKNAVFDASFLAGANGPHLWIGSFDTDELLQFPTAVLGECR